MKTLARKQTAAHIRWVVRRDIPEMLAIENASFQYPWSETDFVHALRQRNCIGMVAEHHERIVGYMIYELHRNRLHLLNIAVCPQGNGIGRQLIDKLKSQLCRGPNRRNKLLCEVRETNLDACLFFKAMGFRAISLLKDFYTDERFPTDEDAILFQYRCREAA